MNNTDVPIWEKYTLTVEEASKYFRIGEKKLRKLAEENLDAGWVIVNGNRIQIKRKQFEKIIDTLDEMRCPKRPSCFDKAGIRRRVLASSCYPAFFRGHQRVGTPEYLAMMRLRKIWAEGSFSVLKREHCISRIRKRGILAATEECLLAAMALNLKRMVNAIFRYPQIYCSAGTSVGFSSFFAFVNRSLIVPYPHESPGRIRYDSVCKTAAKIVNIVKVEHTLPLRDGVCSTNAQIRDGSSYLVIRKSGTTVTPHLYSLE